MDPKTPRPTKADDGYVRITLTTKALTNPEVMEAARTLIRAMGRAK